MSVEGIFINQRRNCVSYSEQTNEWIEKRKQYIVRGVSNGNLAIAKEAKGATVTDLDGEQWIDFASAIGVLNIGHSHPKVVAAVKEQAEKFLLPGFNVHEEKLCEKGLVILGRAFEEVAK